MIEIIRPGPLTTIQDLGRPGMAALGVGPSGAADRRSAALANRLVGNENTAACLETTYGGLSVRFTRLARVAVTGAPCPITRDGRDEAMNAPFTVHSGQTVTLGRPASGLRSYLAVRGGIGVEPVLGSRSTDVLSGVGPPALAAGTRLPIGADSASWATVEVAPVAPPPRGELELRVVPGPRDDWFTPETRELLTSARYTVTADSNRVGARLDGPALTWNRHEELPSEGTVTGAIQVPPSGLPVIFLADHPVTGGYPVLGVLVSDDIPVAAQATPGQSIRFRRYSVRR